MKKLMRKLPFVVRIHGKCIALIPVNVINKKYYTLSLVSTYLRK